MSARARRTAGASAADGGRERPDEPRLVENCRAIGCRAWILPSELFCERHDALLQSDIRAILKKKYRPGKTPSKVFEQTLARALEEILYAQTAGHKFPRAAAFDFDDAPGEPQK